MGMVTVHLDKLIVAIAGAAPHRADTPKILQGLGAAAMQKWKKLAQQGLRSTSQDYIKGLQEEYKGNKFTIELTGMLPNMLERGWPGGDMREWMLKSPKVKQGPNGPYLTIPFRHGTPGTGGRNVGPAMPSAIHKAALTLDPTKSRPGGLQGKSKNTDWGKKGRLHPGLNIGAKAKAILERRAKPWHSASIYMGMVRKEKTYEKGKQSGGYTTFRTISRNSSAEGKHWVHPGIKARRFAPKVKAHIDKIAMGVLNNAIGSK